MRDTVWLTLLALCLVCVLVAAVDHNKFKKCKDSAFCRRNRALAEQTEGESPFALVPNSALLASSGDRFSAEVVNRLNDHRFRLDLTSFGDDVFRLHLDEKQPLRPRYQAPDVLLPGLSTQPPSKTAPVSSAGLVLGAVEISASPLSFKFFDPRDGELLVEVNGRGLLNFEELRSRPVEEKVVIDIPAADANQGGEGEDAAEDDDEDLVRQQGNQNQPSPFKTFSSDGLWEERFSSQNDEKPFGPSSVGVDFTFFNTKNVFGIPEHASSFSLKTTVGKTDPYRLFNLDVFEYELDQTMALYGSVPFMLAQRTDGKTVGLFVLNPSETWIDIQHFSDEEKPRVETHWFSESGVLDVFVLTGPTPKDVMSQYAKLTGFPQLPPLFSIAYHQCRWNYRDQEDVAFVDSKFDENDLPYDVIWLDIEHTDGKRYFTWDSSKFPNSIKMIDSIASKGRKMVTIVDPHIKQDRSYRLNEEATRDGLYVKNADGKNDFIGSCWPGSSSYPDFSDQRVREWWAKQFALDKYQGSTFDLFTWNDMNEPSVFNFPEVTMPKDLRHNGGSCGQDISLSLLPPSFNNNNNNNNLLSQSSSSSSSSSPSSLACRDVKRQGEDHPFEHRDVHNLYGFWLHQSTFAGLIQRDPNHNLRPFVLSRAFFAGSQRYGAIWTGDNAADWSHLQAAQPMLLSLSVSGINFCGADVGGFFGNPDAELMQRWYQAGAFHPFFRGHAHLDSKRREPYLFPERTVSIIRSALRRRYALLPLWYTLFHQSTVSGVPPMRPLWFEYPTDVETFAIEDQFLVGSDLLVKPITSPSTYSTSMFFPGNEKWFELDVWSSVDPSLLPPSRRQVVDAPADRIPVYQRAGSIIPRKDRPRRSSKAMVNDPFTLIVALDSKGSAQGELYIDDGFSFDAQRKGMFHHRSFRFADGKLVSSTIHRNDGLKEISQVERIIVLGLPSAPSSVSVVDPRSGETRVLHTTKGPNNSLIVKRPDVFVADDWTISFSFA